MKSPTHESPTSSVGGLYTGGNANGRHHHQHAPVATAHHPAASSPGYNPAITELNPFQVERLTAVLTEPVEIHGRENFPTLEIQLYRLIGNVKRKLEHVGIQLPNVKMNGGAASYVLANADNFAYSDLDLIFPISLADERNFDRVRSAVFAALLDLMPETANKAMICADTLKDVYIRKMVKVSDGDRWSLFSLHNDFGRCIELKFVDKMRRQFEFSVDSFQITLDPLLDILNAEPVAAAAAKRGEKTGERCGQQKQTRKASTPSVAIKAESMYGDVITALAHLNKRLIDTRNPEEIRGGGLLKYCHLLSRGYHSTPNCRNMERYMCSRFFIDFPDINVQENKLRAYLDNHFGAQDLLKLEYLQLLYKVIRESTVCLMGHERRLTLQMVDRLRQILSFNLYYGNCTEMASLSSQHTHYYNHHLNPLMVHYPVVPVVRAKRHQQQHQQPQRPPSSLVIHQIRPPQFDSSSVTSGETSPSSSTSESESVPSSSSATSSAASSRQSGASVHVPRQTLLYLPQNATRWIPVT